MDSVSGLSKMQAEFERERAESLAQQRRIHESLWYVAVVALEDAQDLVSGLEAAQARANAQTREMLYMQADALYAVLRDAVRLVVTGYPDGDARWVRLDGVLPYNLGESSCATSLRSGWGMMDAWRREAGQRMDNTDRAFFRRYTLALDDLEFLREAEATLDAVAAEDGTDAVIPAARQVESAHTAYREALHDHHWLAWVGYSGADGYVLAMETFAGTVRPLAGRDTPLSTRQRETLQKNHCRYERAWDCFIQDDDNQPTQEAMAISLHVDVKTIRRWEDGFRKLGLATVSRS
ncbi:MAG: hypothetical protein QM753_11840 [Thermomicrobiales bacterium]